MNSECANCAFCKNLFLNVNSISFTVIQTVQLCLEKKYERIKVLENDLCHNEALILEQKKDIENLFKERSELFMQQEQLEALANKMSVNLAETKSKYDSDSSYLKNKIKLLEEQIISQIQLIKTYNHEKLNLVEELTRLVQKVSCDHLCSSP